MDLINRSWEILLIGGNSGTGKTTLAKQLGTSLQIPSLQLDDIRLAMQEIADPKLQKDLFGFLNPTPGLFEGNHEAIAETLYAIGKAVFPGLRVVIQNHTVFNKQPVIIEGDGILPEQIKKFKNDAIKAIFLWDEKEALLDRERKRNEEGHTRGAKINGRSEENFDKWVEQYTSVSYLFGQRIKNEAEEEGYSSFKASPIDSLYERVLTFLKNE